LNTAKEVYQKFRNDAKFIALINKYSIELGELFNDNDEEVNVAR
jgi:hypothetical protein